MLNFVHSVMNTRPPFSLCICVNTCDLFLSLERKIIIELENVGSIVLADKSLSKGRKGERLPSLVSGPSKWGAEARSIRSRFYSKTAKGSGGCTIEIKVPYPHPSLDASPQWSLERPK